MVDMFIGEIVHYIDDMMQLKAAIITAQCDNCFDLEVFGELDENRRFLKDVPRNEHYVITVAKTWRKKRGN